MLPSTVARGARTPELPTEPGIFRGTAIFRELVVHLDGDPRPTMCVGIPRRPHAERRGKHAIKWEEKRKIPGIFLVDIVAF